MSVTLRPDDLVLVTGGSGFLGSAVVRTLLARGSRVRALVRSSSPPDNLRSLDCEIVAGDLTDQASLKAAMQGVRHLFHVAADYRFWARDPSVILRANVDGTRSLMREALSAGVERIVYTTSVATLRVAGATSPVDETRRSRRPRRSGPTSAARPWPSGWSRAWSRDKLPAVIVNPSTPIGPRDIKPTPTGRIVLEAARGRIPAFVDTGLNLVHVDDVAEGHLLALEQGRIGERYILGGQDVPLQRCWPRSPASVGRRRRASSCRAAPLYPLAFAAEAIARVTGKEPLLTVDALKMARTTCSSPPPRPSASSATAPALSGGRGRRPRLVPRGGVSDMSLATVSGVLALGDLALPAGRPRRLLAGARARRRERAARARRAGRPWSPSSRRATRPT